VSARAGGAAPRFASTQTWMSGALEFADKYVALDAARARAVRAPSHGG